MGRRKWKQLKRPEIKPHHAIKRYQWAQRYQHFQPEDWARVKWSDECTVERGAGIRPIWTFRRPSEQLIEGHVCTRRVGKGVKQMFWAAFGQGFRSGLVPLHGDPDAPRGGVSSRVIRDLYTAFLPEIIQPGDIFMQDNAAVHTARIIREILIEMGI